MVNVLINCDVYEGGKITGVRMWARNCAYTANKHKYCHECVRANVCNLEPNKVRKILEEGLVVEAI